eukprot:13079351-Alexandrium_andersonii.AAC.1
MSASLVGSEMCIRDRFSLPSPPCVDQWIVPLASIVVVAAGMKAVGWNRGENDLVGCTLAEAMRSY